MSELQEVDIEQELTKSEKSKTPTLSINTEPLEESGNQPQDQQNKDETKMSQKELLASLIEGSSNESNDNVGKDQQVEENGEEEDSVEQDNIKSNQPISLQIGEIPEEEIAKSSVDKSESPIEGDEVDETQLSESPLEEGEVDETQLSKSPLGENISESKKVSMIEESDESSDEEDEGLYYKNLEEDIDKNILKFYHPETENINYKELLTLSNIIKNKKGKIIDPFHKTVPFLTQYEKAKILGQRAKQINHGSIPFVDVPPNIIDGHTIALMELNQQKIPFIIRRPLPNGTSEYWKVKDLKVIS